MTYSQRVGKYMRLRQELWVCCRARRLDAAHIARLSTEIAALERVMALPLRHARVDAVLAKPGTAMQRTGSSAV